MRIAFVGKGGSGKTTCAALFAKYLEKERPGMPLLAIDADINMHLPELLGATHVIPPMLHISHPDAVRAIRAQLIGSNVRIKTPAHFRKTTPPAAGSNFVVLHDPKDLILENFSVAVGGMRLMAVGTYDSDEIGASCYHNNLAILENILSHCVDREGVIVSDMVAGVDAFANTLHAQFDLLILVVEPTKRGIEVLRQYQYLAGEAGVADVLRVVGNKVRTESDEMFLRENIPNDQLLGFFKESEYLRRKEQEGGALDIDALEEENKSLLKRILTVLEEKKTSHQERLLRLHAIHARYVAQPFITERFGDLSDQIDPSFDFDEQTGKIF